MASFSARQPWWKNAQGEWYVILQGVLFLLVALSPSYQKLTVDLPVRWHTLVVITGLVLGGLGLLLVLAGGFFLGNNLSPLPHPREDAMLVQVGVYSFVRHPMYSGAVFAAAGWGLLNTNLLTLICAGVLLVFFDIKSRREERWLAYRFPEYSAY